MIYEIRLRIKKPLLGDTFDQKAGKSGIFRFPRGDDGTWSLDHRMMHAWTGKILNAINALDLTIDPDTICLPSDILLPGLHLFEEKLRFRPEKKDRTVDRESIPRNVVLTFCVLIRETDGKAPNNLQYPSAEQLHAIFQIIGDYEGISPYGSVRGWGRFSVEGIRPVGRSPIDARELPDGGETDIHLPGEEDGDSRLQTGDDPQQG